MNYLRRNMRNLPACISSARGFTLVEMIVVMAIFMGIIIISSEAFNKIVSISSQQTKSAESDTQGVIGLEMMRIDLEHAGYGLPWVLPFTANFAEVPTTVTDLADGIETDSFNDSAMVSPASDTDPRKTPRALQAASSTTDNRDYLVIKSMLVGMSVTAKKWAYLEHSGDDSRLKPWGTDNFITGERVVTLDSRTKRLIGNVTDGVSYELTAAMVGASPTAPPPTAFQPPSPTDVYLVYGVDPDNNLRAPYNRVDYYVKRPDDADKMPTRCAPGTGILYKAVMNQNGGEFMQYPLVECIADMQVVFNLYTENVTTGVKGNRYIKVEVGDNELKNLSAKQIREQLKEVIVYIVAHEGGKDTRFNYDKDKDLNVGEGNGRTLDLEALAGADYRHYRWKTYKIAVAPKNINY